MSTRNGQNNNQSYDEWGDPVKQKDKRQKGGPKIYEDEWGDPSNKAAQIDLSERQRLQLEKRLVNDGMIYPRSHYLPKGHLRGIIAILLAFVFGLFLGVGALLGAGIFAGTTVKIEKIPSSDKYFAEDYLDKTVLDLVNDVLGDLKEYSGFDNFTLDTVSKYTPVVDNALDSVARQLSENYGVTLDKEELSSTSFGKIGEYSQNLLKSVELGKVFSKIAGDQPMSTLLYALCYGKEGEDYTKDEEGNVTMLGESKPTTIDTLISKDGMDGVIEKVKSIPLKDIITIGDDASPLFKRIGTLSVNELMDEKTVMSFKLGEIITINEEDPKTSALLKSLKDTTVEDLTKEETIQNLTLGEVLSIDENDPNASELFITLKDKQIGELMKEETIKGLHLKDIIKIDKNSSKLLQSLQNKTIDDLGKEKTINSLLIGDLIAIDKNSSKLLQSLQNNTVGDLKNEDTIQNLQLGAILDLENATGIMKAVKDWTVKDLSDTKRIERLKISDLIDMNGSDSKLLAAISDWRIGDLKQQQKFDSLTLADTIDLTGETGIMSAIGNVPLGNLQKEINKLKIGDILVGEDGKPIDFEKSGNKILKNLTSSTLETLDYDLKSLTVAQVFGDEIYSYMELSDKDGTTVNYQYLKDGYFGTTNVDGKEKNNFELASYNQIGEDGKRDPNMFLWRPEAVLNASNQGFRKEFKANGKTVTVAYYTEDGKLFDDSMGTVKYDALINKQNKQGLETDPMYQTESPYYYEAEVRLTPVYSYYLIDFENDAETPLSGHTETDAEGLWFVTDDSVRYALDEDGESIELNRVITYTESVPEGATVRIGTDGNGEEYSYYLQRHTLLQKYSDGTNTYEMTDSRVTEHYYYTDDTGAEKELSRYLSGVWYLLLGENGAGAESHVMDLDSTVTDVTDTLQDTNLATLWFYGLLDDNPYVELDGLTKLPGFQNGVVLDEKYVTNLIQLSLGELVPFIEGINKGLTDLTIPPVIS